MVHANTLGLQDFKPVPLQRTITPVFGPSAASTIAATVSPPLTTIAAPVNAANEGFFSGDTLLATQYGGVVVLNLLSALFSGLVLGLLSLDVTDLEILKKCGTERERRYAATIMPMRRHSNLLLCSLVVGNVLVNAYLQKLLDTVFPGLIGFISTTCCITIFGEIVPQAVCSRHGLAIGANTIWLTWLVIIVTLPVSYPLSLVLDCALGDEIAFVYDRERLQEYIRITKSYNNLDAQETNIIMGALKIKKVSVGQIMTKLKDIFMLDVESIINYHTMVMIMKKGYSRIPVYKDSRKNIVGLLLVRDLAMVNPYTEVTLRSILAFYRHPTILVDENNTLDLAFNHFRDGKSHMAFVREHRRKDVIGLVTLEDIIEEVLQVEINDETDLFTNNRDLKHRPEAQIPNDLETLHIHLNDAMAKRKNPDKAFGPQARSPVPLQVNRRPHKIPRLKTHSNSINKASVTKDKG